MATPAPHQAAAAQDGGASAEPDPEQRARASGSAAVCRVDGCGAALAAEKRFYRRSRCCKAHALAEQVYLSGEAKRFCQQCCGFHDVAAFDGPRRSCRERLAAHKDRQRRKWQASHGRRGSDSASSGAEDEAADAQEATQPTTVTRAGRPSRRPSLLRASTGTSDSPSPERRAAALEEAPPQHRPRGGGAHPVGDLSPNARAYSGSFHGEQQQQQGRPPPTAFQQALAMSRSHSNALPEALGQEAAGVRARRSLSMSQMQAQQLPPAEFWLGERGEPLAPPQHPRNMAGPDDGVASHEVSWFPDLQAWHRSPRRSAHSPQEPDTEAALWSRRPTKRRSVPAPDGAALAEAAEAAAAAGLWPPQHHQPQHGPGAAPGRSPRGAAPLRHHWAGSPQLQHPQQHPPPLALPQQQWAPTPAVERSEGLLQPQHFGGTKFEHQIATAAGDPASAQSHATTTAAMDYDWEASVAATNVQQGLAAMAMHGGSSSNLHQDQQVLAAAAELHAQAEPAAGLLPSSLGLPNEAEARAFASQAPEPLWLAQQLVGATMKTEHQPLYSYGLVATLRSLSDANGPQPAPPPPPQQQQQQHARPPLQHTGRFLSSSAPDFGHVGHTAQSMHEGARAAHLQQQQAAERLRQHQQAAWESHQADMEARQSEVLAMQRELHAEYRATMQQAQQRQSPRDDRFEARGLPSVDFSPTVKRVSWSAGIGGQGGAAAARPASLPPQVSALACAAAADSSLQGGWPPAARGQLSPVNRPGSAQLRPPASPPQQPQHRPNSAM